MTEYTAARVPKLFHDSEGIIWQMRSEAIDSNWMEFVSFPKI